MPYAGLRHFVDDLRSNAILSGTLSLLPLRQLMLTATGEAIAMAAANAVAIAAAIAAAIAELAASLTLPP